MIIPKGRDKLLWFNPFYHYGKGFSDLFMSAGEFEKENKTVI